MGQPQMRTCVQCGRQIPWDANVCQYCGHDYRAQAQAPPKKKGVLPVVGGVLILIAGIIELILGVSLAASTSFLSGVLPFDVTSIGIACGAVIAVLGIIAILGGIFAIQRKHFGLAILGGILGLPAFFIPGLIGLILVAVGREDFD